MDMFQIVQAAVLLVLQNARQWARRSHNGHLNNNALALITQNQQATDLAGLIEVADAIVRRIYPYVLVEEAELIGALCDLRDGPLDEKAKTTALARLLALALPTRVQQKTAVLARMTTQFVGHEIRITDLRQPIRESVGTCVAVVLVDNSYNIALTDGSHYVFDDPDQLDGTGMECQLRWNAWRRRIQVI